MTFESSLIAIGCVLFITYGVVVNRWSERLVPPITTLIIGWTIVVGFVLLNRWLLPTA